MTEFGYSLSSEEHAPNDLVRYAQRAEATGFTFAAISDHYHPWVDQQGHSPFVWSVLGGIAHATSTLRLGTGVTCPTVRIHPAIIAQAAATVAAMMPGRFFLGVGSGENLNEHILGDHWPPAPVRLEMLAEAVAVIRRLWEGGTRASTGPTTPSRTPVSTPCPTSFRRSSWRPAGRRPPPWPGRRATDCGRLRQKRSSSRSSPRRVAQAPSTARSPMCWAAEEDEAKKTAYEWWPNAGIGGELSQELPLPRHFQQAAELLTPDDLAEKIPLGPDPDRHVEAVKAFVDAGYDHVYVHQIGPDQDGFFDFFERELARRL